MIYLDNGATTFPKPQIVVNAVNSATRNFSANPGRGGHRMAMKASEMVFESRNTVADFFGVDNPEKVIFTLNCTTALNTVIKGVLHPGDHVIISSYEHNAVVRPLEKLKEKGISYTVAQVVEGDNEQTLNNFRDAIKDNTKLMICTMASNVFGIKLPVERLCALCHQYDILCCVDGAQGAGVVPVDLSNSSIDFLCLASHKSLYGPMGIGVLIINCDTVPDSLIEGGTGSNSFDTRQPEILPDKFESGTNNFSGIIGLNAGIKFVKSKGLMNIYRKEMSLMTYLYKRLKNKNKIILYTEEPNIDFYVPLLSFNVKDYESEKTAEILNSRYGIATRSGLHCAPLAHITKGTEKIGTVRVVPSVFTTKNDIDTLIYAISNI